MLPYVKCFHHLWPETVKHHIPNITFQILYFFSRPTTQHVDQDKQTAYKSSIKFVLVWQVLIYGVLVVAAPYIAEMFSSDKEVAEIIILFMWILPLSYGFLGVIILTNSSFNALHKPFIALVLSILRLFVCYLPFAYVGSFFWGLQGLFIGASIGNVVMAAISYNMFSKQFTHNCSNSNNQGAQT